MRFSVIQSSNSRHPANSITKGRIFPCAVRTKQISHFAQYYGGGLQRNPTHHITVHLLLLNANGSHPAGIFPAALQAGELHFAHRAQ